MQKALIIAEAWAKTHNLEFSSSKTKVILYTYKTKFDFPEPLKMGQENLEYATRVKHLGVWLDPKLDFRYHLSEKIKEGKSIIGRLKGSMGNRGAHSKKIVSKLVQLQFKINESI